MAARLQIRLSDSNCSEIDELMKELNLSSQKELINDALTLYKWAVNQKKNGRLVTSMNESTQTYKEVETPILSRVKVKHV